MQKRLFFPLTFLLALLFISTLQAQSGFIKTDGTLLKDEAGDIFSIKGIAFGNNVWSNPKYPVKTHHNETDYKRLKEMGFNSIRFYINYDLFESDKKPYTYKDSGFDWIDTNIEWAKKHGIRLILNMHCPQGGFQSNGDGSAFWKNSQNQRRFIALWKEIARRYSDEPVILGYSLLNEPFLEHSFTEYEKLLKKLTKEIRQVDSRHILIIERANALRWSYKDNENGEMNFILVDAPNTMYEFHFYEPFEVTHQNAPWTYLKGQFATYPDMSQFKASGSTQWESTTWNVPVLDVKDTKKQNQWTFLESPLIKVTNKEHALGIPTFQAKGLGEAGSASARDFLIEEYDQNKKLIRTAFLLKNAKDKKWYYWSSNTTGEGSYITDSAGQYKYLQIKGNTGDANLAYSPGKFPVKQGYYYKISGSVKAENTNPQAEIRLRLDFYSLEGEIVPLDKSFLELRMKRYIDWGKQKNVPLYMGEFGMIADGFEKNRGGLKWVKDMLDICEENNINFNYHTYHEYKTFGLYRTDAGHLPGDPNMPLVELFKKRLAGR